MTNAVDVVFSKEIAALEAEIHEKVSAYTLADAIRGGSSVTEQARNWGDTGQACALTAAAIHIRAMKDQ